MQIEIENGGGANAARSAQSFQGDDQSVEGAEPLAMAGAGMMESAGQSSGDAVIERGYRGGQNAAVSQQHAGKKFRRPGELLRFGQCAGLAGLDGGDIFRGVDAQEVAFRDGRRRHDCEAGDFPHLFRHQGELPHGHDVIADGRGKGGMMIKFHGPGATSVMGGSRGMSSPSGG